MVDWFKAKDPIKYRLDGETSKNVKGDTFICSCRNIQVGHQASSELYYLKKWIW
ncbi:373_t:CDS:2, partial [Funneliformis geosporum]